SPADAAMALSLEEQTRKVLATLTPREEQILRLRFGIGEKSDYTLEEVGQRFQVTRERIRQIEAKALRKLRKPSRPKNRENFAHRWRGRSPERGGRSPALRGAPGAGRAAPSRSPCQGARRTRRPGTGPTPRRARMTARDAMPRPGHLPALDGLRGVCLLAVFF